MLNNHVNEFYLLALIDFKNGVSVEELKKTLKMYEDIEDYEACAGILKAINELENDY
jgi:protein-arginine kinase activator protein McsA|tara:strand:- start:7652 stop:7822 length:171 start_codon:yes stop_codon:yes gene_type:complete